VKLDEMGGSGRTRKGRLLRNFCSLPGGKEKRELQEVRKGKKKVISFLLVCPEVLEPPC